MSVDLVAGELVYQRCRWCGTASFRRLLCPACASSDLDSHRSDGRGVVVRSTVVSRYRRAMRSESVVRFPEGFTLRCRVVGAPPHLVREGTRVRPVTGTDPAAGELVFEVFGVCDTDDRERWRRQQ
ncbi:Zn-ribbon domain-containing OB-fold protein [Streptomyces sp. NRRL B-24572]|uniref:Zn-ribbon domain-containing OB-fold protein n=1 Tax=Streptomyces sp. NRRL B-24572 TaxID=1962156 RepID=UPI00211AA6A4|nr:zinc ribbon domain-containing protein [Streptomyces sp. NRRL B-24572]